MKFDTDCYSVLKIEVQVSIC